MRGSSRYGMIVLALCAACGNPSGHSGVRQPIDIGPGEIGTVVGSGERATDPVDGNADGVVDPPIPVLEARIDTPMDVALSPTGQLFVIDWNGHKIRAVTADQKLAFEVGTGIEGDACEGTLVDGKCPKDKAELNHPTDMTFDGQGRMMIAAWHNARLKRTDFQTALVENFCGSGARKYAGDGGPCHDAQGLDLVSFDLPSSVVFDSAGNLFVSDQANQIVRRLGTDGIVKTVVGNCPGTAGFGCTAGQGYSGDGGPATAAHLFNQLGQGTDPQGKIALDSAGNMYIADTGNNVVRKVTPGPDGVIGDGDPTLEVITTVAGNGQPGYSGDGGPALQAMLNGPTDVDVAMDGTIYIADRANSCVRAVAPDGTISTVAGQCGSTGFSGDGGPATQALLWTPYGVELDGKGGLYISDTRNNCIRKVVLN